MNFRFRLGPFTFGRGGARLSLWSRSAGISIPLSGKKGRTFGKIGFGPFRWFFGRSPAKLSTKQHSQAEIEEKQFMIGSYEEEAIKSFESDWKFLENLRQNGIPWRGIQERLKEELPEHIIDRDDIAYRLVPIAMDAVFGKQNSAWKTEKRSSKSGKGFTTWIIII